MPSALWIHAGVDALRSGELRRLGAPALALAGEDGWSCDLVSGSALSERQADVAVVPLQAAWAIPLLSRSPSAKILIEANARATTIDARAGALLAGLSNRIAGVVARDPVSELWASQILDGAGNVLLVPDPGLRRVELAAVALQFDSPALVEPQASLPDDFELWFSEPGDHIEAGEIEALSLAWRQPEAKRVVVAPRFIRSWLKQAGVQALSLEWSPSVLHQALTQASRCLFLGPETYAQARRRVTALRSGALAAAPMIAPPAVFEPAQVAQGWAEALSSARPPRARRHAGSETPITVLIFLDLIQDLDPMLPMIDALLGRTNVKLRVAATDWVRNHSPRVVAEVEARGLSIEVYARELVLEGAAPSLHKVDCIVGGAESNLPAHAGAHALFRRAREARVPTFALQHGVENVGLHYMPGDDDDVNLIADYLFVWFPPDRTPDLVSAALRPRLVHVGRPPVTPADLAHISGMFSAFEAIVAVFENLHWSRYSAAWRSQFLTDCTEFALANPDRAVILKPHHAGLWSVKNRHLIPQWPSNLIIADPTDPFWEPFTAGSLVRLADAVITSPSTVALDAAQAGKPVAVGAYGLELPLYAPLPLLQRAQDWGDFIATAGAVEDARRRAIFLSRTAVGDDPAEKAATYVVAAARSRLRSPRQRPASNMLARA